MRSRVKKKVTAVTGQRYSKRTGLLQQTNIKSKMWEFKKNRNGLRNQIKALL
jgi:hypothetical protein